MRSSIRCVVVQTLEPRCLFAAGDLDLTFGGGDGIATLDGQIGNTGVPVSAFQADGRLILAARSQFSSSAGTNVSTVLRRVNADGSIDNTFASGGITFDGDVAITKVLVEPNGNVLAMGNARDGTGLLLRYTSAGVAAPLTAAPNGVGQLLESVDRATDGDYYVAGKFKNPDSTAYEYGLARLNSDGSFDTAFDGDGLKFFTVDGSAAAPQSVSVMPNGNLAVLGGNGTLIFGARVSPAGAVLAIDARTDAVNGVYPEAGGTAATANNRPIYQINTPVAAGGSAVFQSELRTTSSTGDRSGDLFSASALVPGESAGVITNGLGVISAVRRSTGEFVLTKIDAAGAAAAFQKTYAPGGSNNYISSMRVVGDKLLVAVKQLSGNSGNLPAFSIVRIDLTAPAQTSTAKIAGVVFNDANANQHRDASEAGLAGRTVYVDANNNGQLDAGEKSAFTDGGGYYELTGVATGTYTVRQVLPTGWTQTTPAAGQSVNITTDGQYAFLSDFGSKATVTPPPTTTAPAAPKSAKAVLVTSPKRLVRLTWTDAASNETGYRMERRYRGETTWTAIATLGANASKYDDTTAYKGVAYEYRIVAINTAGAAVSSVLSIKA